MNHRPDPSTCIILSIADNKVSKTIVDPINVIYTIRIIQNLSGYSYWF